MRWRCVDFDFEFPRRALVMGVVNVTPDSFSDQGQFFDTEAAVARAMALAAEGADLIDVGGESTRPGATPVPVEEELRRVIPVVERLSVMLNIPVSIDTRKPQVADAALRAGASIVNDVQANRSEAGMWEVVATHRAGYVAMHMQGLPENMQENPVYRDVCGEVAGFLATTMDRLGSAGISTEQVVLDPGIGFGKTASHNLSLLAGIGTFRKLGRPLLVGLSRKSFIGSILGAGVADRLPGALACTQWCYLNGVQIFRTHDVVATTQTLRMSEALTSVRACQS